MRGGQANLPWYLAKNFPSADRTLVHGWTEVLRFIHATDPYRRPLSLHPAAINAYTSRHATDDEALLDFDLMQTPHGPSPTAGSPPNGYGTITWEDAMHLPVPAPPAARLRAIAKIAKVLSSLIDTMLGVRPTRAKGRLIRRSMSCDTPLRLWFLHIGDGGRVFAARRARRTPF